VKIAALVASQTGKMKLTRAVIEQILILGYQEGATELKLR
jgi:hypothetical protein